MRSMPSNKKSPDIASASVPDMLAMIKWHFFNVVAKKPVDVTRRVPSETMSYTSSKAPAKTTQFRTGSRQERKIRIDKFTKFADVNCVAGMAEKEKITNPHHKFSETALEAKP